MPEPVNRSASGGSRPARVLPNSMRLLCLRSCERIRPASVKQRALRRGFAYLRARLGIFSQILAAAGLLLAPLFLTSAIVAQLGDYLSEEEAIRIRDAQELYPRTKEYLRVAAARVAEISRRTGKAYDVKVPEEKEKKPKKEKKRKASEAQPEPENPLLFYQLPDVVNGISQSLRAIMTNVDEKYRLKRTEPTEILKSLKLLQTFISQDFSVLDDLEEKARNDEAENLYRAVKNAKENLERARDGAKEALTVLQGSPDDSKKRK